MNKKLILCAAFLLAAVADTFACTNLPIPTDSSVNCITIRQLLTKRGLC